jgi:hypothetical protein
LWTFEKVSTFGIIRREEKRMNLKLYDKVSEEIITIISNHSCEICDLSKNYRIG